MLREANFSTSTVKPHRSRRRNICNESSCEPGAVGEKQNVASYCLLICCRQFVASNCLLICCRQFVVFVFVRFTVREAIHQHQQLGSLAGSGKGTSMKVPVCQAQTVESKLREANFSTSTVRPHRICLRNFCNQSSGSVEGTPAAKVSASHAQTAKSQLREAINSTTAVKPHRIRRKNICNDSSCVSGAISEKQVEGGKLLNVNCEASQDPAKEHLQRKFLRARRHR